MPNKTDFYNNSSMNMPYLEIGIALKDIDRNNPGKIPFSIPILTPDVDTSKQVKSKVPQRDKSNILTDNKGAVDVSDIEVSNYIEIEIPRELCVLANAKYAVEGWLNIEGSGHVQTATLNGTGSISGSLSGTGTVGPPLNYDSLSASGIVSGSISETVSGTHTTDFQKAKVDGELTLKMIAPYHIIPKGSKWLIAFIGGDMSMPRVICRLPD